MNNIHEKDWAEDSWEAYSGMRSHPVRNMVNGKADDKPVAHTDDNVSTTEKVNEGEQMGA